MPFKSEAQRKWMHKNKPKMAAEFEDATPKGANLPERVGRKKGKGWAALANSQTTKRRKGR